MTSSIVFEWTKLLGSSSSDSGTNLTIGSDGSIYIAGTTYGDLDGQTNSGLSDAFLVGKSKEIYAPIDISSSSSSFDENINLGSVVANLSTTTVYL